MTPRLRINTLAAIAAACLLTTGGAGAAGPERPGPGPCP
jgi:hypothetical protein